MIYYKEECVVVENSCQ